MKDKIVPFSKEQLYWIIARAYNVKMSEVQMFFQFQSQFGLETKTMEWLFKECDYYFDSHAVDIEFERWKVLNKKCTFEEIWRKYGNVLNTEDYQYINGKLETNPRNRGY